MPERDYATQIEAPAPDYATMPAPEPLDHGSLRRAANAEPPANAKAIGELWLSRLEALDVVDGYGLAGKDDNSAIAGFDLRMTPDEFDEAVARNDWDVPPHLRWSFSPPLVAPRVSEAARTAIRIWPASTQRTGLQNQAADGGRIILRDGCFFLQREGGDGTESLAWFHAETGIDMDEEGYLILVNRMTGETMGRLGEMFTWAAPNPILPGGPSRMEFRAACGDAPVAMVGNPAAQSKMESTYGPRPDPVPPPG
ncbi:hypothetical protein BMF35_a2111 [Aurantiacibacter gangjinensis]|nr:hypothetical protein BMF35_a2111 [Aurantiacibacter gangjinensis]